MEVENLGTPELSTRNLIRPSLPSSEANTSVCTFGRCSVTPKKQVTGSSMKDALKDKNAPAASFLSAKISANLRTKVETVLEIGEESHKSAEHWS